MENKNNIIGNNNIVIQGVVDSVITLTIDGEIQEISNKLDALESLLKQQGKDSFQVANQVYQIGDINADNFGDIIRKRAFNMLLTKKLIEEIAPYNDDIQDFLDSINTKNKDNWEIEREYERPAKKHIVQNFMWVISRELERLFSIVKDPPDERIDNYIEHCLRTYKLSLQIMNYTLLSQLWDYKKEELIVDIKEDTIKNLFTSKLKLRHDECLQVFQALMAIYKAKKLDFPITELKDLDLESTEEGSWLHACEELHEIRSVFYQGTHQLHHCFEAEKHLTTILLAFKFLANYQLISMKKIEFEQFRNSETPRYIKDFNILGKRGKQQKQANHERYIKYSKDASFTYAVFLHNATTSINLFPFVLDYNALMNEEGSKIYFYENKIGQSGLAYFFIDGESDELIHYKAIITNELEEIALNEENQKYLKLDIALLQFQEAQNMILGTTGMFKPFKKKQQNFGNI